MKETRFKDPWQRNEELRWLSEKALLHVDLDEYDLAEEDLLAADGALEELCRVGVPGYDPWDDAEDCHFDHAEARRAIRYFPEILKHVKGPLADQPFVLAPWQQAVQGNVFGWKRDEDGLRRYREVWIYVPKKNGKSAWIAGIVLQVMTTDGELGAELYSAAASRDQAALVFEHASGMVEKEPELRAILRVYGDKGGSAMKSIAYPGQRSYYRCLAADEKLSDGKNPSLVAADEIHRHKSPDLVNVLKKSAIARAQPLIFMFTTAGEFGESMVNTEHAFAKKIRDGVVRKQSYLPVIYEAEQDDDWTDRRTWWKANPNLDVTIPEKEIAELCEDAKNKPTELNDVKRLHLNITTNSAKAAISYAAWLACARGRVKLEDLVGQPCFGGLDMSSKIDLSAFALWFPKQKAVLVRFWRPKDTVGEAEERDRVSYTTWEREGYMELTEGDVVDHKHVEDSIVEFVAPYRMEDAAFDPKHAEAMRQALDKRGLAMVEFNQSATNYNEACKELEALIASKEFEHFDNPVLGWNASNLVWRTDRDLNYMPDKKKSNSRIDGMVAALMAIARSIKTKGPKESVYEKRGVFSV